MLHGRILRNGRVVKPNCFYLYHGNSIDWQMPISAGNDFLLLEDFLSRKLWSHDILFDVLLRCCASEVPCCLSQGSNVCWRIVGRFFGLFWNLYGSNNVKLLLLTSARHGMRCFGRFTFPDILELMDRSLYDCVVYEIGDRSSSRRKIWHAPG